ncbi:MAG: TIM barrel protein [Erysipelotrichaceae bacterium]|nr:TIM barrel protein [Erysipelotrichaceae bacterium]
MRKLLKCALDIEQIKYKNTLDFIDGYELHLYGDERDDFSLIQQMTKPICTIHYPLDRCDIIEIAKEFKTEYAQSVFELCKRLNVGLVLHAESKYYEVMASKDVDAFCDYIKDNNITVYIENCYRNIGAIEAIQIRRYIRARIGLEKVFSLLDTCHLMMSEMSFKYDELSFAEAIEKFKSSNFVIHLNDCIGSGEKETGGIHGTNFHNNLYLLNNVLWKLYTLEKDGYYAKLVLECDEKDYVHCPNAVELAHNIDNFWKTY